MAKRKKSKGDKNMAAVSPYAGEGEHLSSGIDKVENGYIVSASGGGGGGDYWSKRYIAKDRPEALKISNSCLAGGSKGGRKKSSGKKKAALKRG